MIATKRGETWQSRTRPRAATAAGEWRLRVMSAWVLWYFLFQGAFGLAWDIRWHTAVGRDSFFTPPHLLIYSGVGLAGLLALALVLLETWRYHRGATGVDATTTWPVLWVFHAPLGVIVTGCGLAVMLVAAPFDNWWHELYGIDVVLWSPFHVMGLIGAFIGGCGLVYSFAALAARDRSERPAASTVLGFRGLEWATLLALSGVMSLLLTAAQPATTIAPTLDLGRASLLTYPLLLCAWLPALFVAAVRLTRRPGAASLTLLLYTLRQLFTVAAVPRAIAWLVAANGYQYRGDPPRFSLFLALSPLLFLPAALVVDGVTLRRSGAGSVRWLAGRGVGWVGVLAALPLSALAPLLVRQTASIARAGQLPPDFVIPQFILTPAWLLALPVSVCLAAASAMLGAGWGAILALNDR